MFIIILFFWLSLSVSHYSLFCRKIFFSFEWYPSLLNIHLTTVFATRVLLLLNMFASAPDYLPIIYSLTAYFPCKFPFWIFPLRNIFPLQVFSRLPIFHLQATFFIALNPLTYFLLQFPLQIISPSPSLFTISSSCPIFPSLSTISTLCPISLLAVYYFLSLL